MQLVYISIFFVLSIFLTIYIVKHYYLGLNNGLLDKENSNLKKEIICLREKLDDFLKDITKLEKKSYQEGLEEGINRNKLFVKIEPIENITNSNFWILKKESIEIGFEYQLFINNIPTEFKSKHILKTLKKSDINEENIKKILIGIEQIESLRNGNFIISNTINLVKDNLLKQLKK